MLSGIQVRASLFSAKLVCNGITAKNFFCAYMSSRFFGNSIQNKREISKNK